MRDPENTSEIMIVNVLCFFHDFYFQLNKILRHIKNQISENELNLNRYFF